MTQRFFQSPKHLGAVDNFGTKLAAISRELHSHALYLTKDTEQAKDLLQDTFERALRFEYRFERGTNLNAWAHQILHNLFISACRRRTTETRMTQQMRHETSSWTSGAWHPNRCEELSDTMRRAIDGLAPPYRATIWLIDVQGYSYREAALRLSVPEGTIMSRLHRARRMLAAALLSERMQRIAA